MVRYRIQYVLASRSALTLGRSVGQMVAVALLGLGLAAGITTAGTSSGGTSAPGDAVPSQSTQDVEQPIRLLMIETATCSFCRRWHAEIGPAYPKSREGQFAPLVRAGFDAPELKGLKPVTFTPTFIVLRGTMEVGRLTGYPGQDYFWDEIREVLKPAGYVVETSPLP